KKKDSQNRYLLEPDPTQATVYRLLGTPFRVTTQMPDDTVILADMSQVAVARDVDVSVRLLDQVEARTDSLALRVVSRWDIGSQPRGRRGDDRDHQLTAMPHLPRHDDPARRSTRGR